MKRYLGLKLSIFEFWDIVLPILNKLTLNREYKRFIEDIYLISIDNLKFNLRDKVQSYNDFKEIGSVQKVQN